MSRLEDHRQKQFRNKVILYIALIVGLGIFMMTAGLKFLINSTVYLGNLSSGKQSTTPSNKPSTLYGTLDIDTIVDATNSAKIIVSGTVVNYDKLEFYINDDKVKDYDVASEQFNQEIGDLKKGNNKVYVKAVNKETKDERKSQTYDVMLNSDKPKLDISQPQDNSKTGNNDLKIVGSTNKDVLIKVNDFPVVVDAGGNFQTSIRLKDGDNKIVITAQDNAGNIESKALTVSYSKDY